MSASTSGDGRRERVLRVVNAATGAVGVFLGGLAASNQIPPEWMRWVAVGMAFDAALQRFLPAAFGPAAPSEPRQ